MSKADSTSATVWGGFESSEYDIKNVHAQLNEVIEREYRSLEKILKHYKNKKILIVGHSTAFASLGTVCCPQGCCIS